MAVDPTELEFKTVQIENESPQQMQAEAERLAADGWRVVPGVLPVTTYEVMRVKGTQARPVLNGGLGTMTFDEDKVLIRSGVDGKLRKADGTIVSEN